MLKFKHPTLIFISGFVWLAIGIFLLSLGIHFLLTPAEAGGFSIVNTISSNFVHDRYNAIVVTLTASLLIGFMKGRFVLAKSAKRQIKRVRSLPNPASLTRLYGIGYYLLIGSMIALGISMRFLPIAPDTRGFVDAAIGAALINGATLYFRNLTTGTAKQ